MEQLHTLKSTLLQFSNATGLVINFHKSTFAPIHVEPALASALASILACTVASFPQSYLGLPLSTHKLNIKDFFFIIDKIDRRLAGWRGVLLNIAGRAIMVRAVLRALPIYAMTALLLPAGIVQEIDKRCRAFFWAGQEKVSGGQCKVAWEFVCAPFSRGGLGFSSLHHLNSCLLLTHLNKIHSDIQNPNSSPLTAKYGWSVSRDVDTSHPFQSSVWRDIAKGITFFRSVTMVQIGNGLTTAFWLDLWVPNNTQNLATIFPAIFSHSVRPSASVARVLSEPQLQLDLAPRLSNAAGIELDNLRTLLASVSLNVQDQDKRRGRIDGKPLTCSSAYKAVWANKPMDPFAPVIWRNYAPNKCRIFLWLSCKNRLFTNERRFKRGLTDSSSCPFCSTSESTEHLFLLATIWVHCGRSSLLSLPPLHRTLRNYGDRNLLTRSVPQ